MSPRLCLLGVPVIAALASIAINRTAAVRQDFNCANANRKAGAFTPAFLGIKFAVDEYDALAGDHLTLPLASSSQIG